MKCRPILPKLVGLDALEKIDSSMPLGTSGWDLNSATFAVLASQSDSFPTSCSHVQFASETSRSIDATPVFFKFIRSLG